MLRFLLLAALAVAVPAAEPFSLARLEEISRGIATLRVPFTQEKRLALFDEPVLSAGAIEISRPLAAVRWEYTGKSVLVLKDGRLRRWGADGAEETAGGDDPGGRAVRGQMQALLSGDWSALEQLFAIAPADGAEPGLVMTPRSPELATYIARIELAFRADLSAPTRLVVAAADGDETVYAFGEPQLGIELTAARFAGP